MEQLVNFIIRPPRAEYDPDHDLLDQEFMLKGKLFQRKDVEVKNSREEVLQCSHYVPIISPDEKPLPCVIYCHGNSGCRADASEAAIILLPSNITVFTLDFSGSGLSGGEHVSLGWHEKDDLKAVVDYLRTDGNVSLIGLWGRSMGAVTSLIYGAEDPSIAGMVLDSPFSDLFDLMMELVDTYKYRPPKFTVKYFIQYMRKTIQKKANFDIMDLNTIKFAKSCFVPVLIGHATEDEFIRPHHSERILEAYMGDKNIIRFDGDHNSPRPQFYFDSINIFFHNVLHPPEDEVGISYYGSTHDYFDKGGWDKLHEIGYPELDCLSPCPGMTIAEELGTSSTADVNEQPHPKRPMSRTDVPAEASLKVKHLEGRGEGDEKKSTPSSTNMISFELSNGGHPYGPHVPATLDDDVYVEYPLDNSADFPSNVDEEEKMFMEAILMSLKDLETRPPNAEAQARANETSLPSSVQEETELPSKTEVAFIPLNNGHSYELAQPASETSSSSTGPTSGTPETALIDTSASTGTTSTSTRSDVSVIVSSSESDTVDNTKATLTVVKNPSSNIMDGLIRRWDFNFFRNNR